MNIHTHITHVHEEMAIISVGKHIEEKNIGNVNI